MLTIDITMRESDTTSASNVAAGTWTGSKVCFGFTGRWPSSKTGLHGVRLGCGEGFGVAAALLGVAGTETARGWESFHLSTRLCNSFAFASGSVSATARGNLKLRAATARKR